MDQPFVCPMCAEAVGQPDADRCPHCGERLASRAAEPPLGPRAARGAWQRRALLALAVVGGVAFVAGVWRATRPPWHAHPQAAALFLTPAAPAAPACAVAAGERWVFVDEGLGRGPIEHPIEVFDVTAAGDVLVDGEDVTFAPSGETIVHPPTGARPWRFLPPAEPEAVLGVRREPLVIGGRTFDCLVVDVLGWRTTMNEMKAAYWVAMSGDVPAFPGVVRVERWNGTTPLGTLRLDRVE